VALALGGLLSFRAEAAEPASPSDAQQKLWTDLASADEVTVMRAILGLAKNPQDTMALLKSNLHPVKADPQRVERLIADLDSNQFATRQRAVEELEYLGKYVKADLEKALASAQGIETKQRVQQLLDKMPKKIEDPKKLPPQRGNGANVVVRAVNGQQQIIVNGVPIDGTGKPPAGPVGPSMYWVRAVRATALLEHLGTKEAKELLEKLAAGEADALPTEQAKAALERLNKR
jgi:hypothetical protein